MAKNKIESTEVLDIHNKVSSVELYNILKKNMTTILNNPNMSSMIPSVMIWSSPGMGKSTIAKDIANEMGIEFIDFRLSYRDPVDLHGIPAADIPNNKAMWLPFDDLPQNPNGKGIILFDELSSVDKSLQNAALQLILDRRIDKYKVPDGYMIIAAGNKSTDRAICQTMASSLANRFLHLELRCNDEDWRMWAQHHDVEPSVIGFISYRPEYLHKMEGENLERGWPSPRSWERVSTMLKIYGDEDESVVRKIIYGLIGNCAGVEFMEFRKINKEFDNIRDVMLNPNRKIDIPERSSAKYAIVSAMIYQLWRSKNDEEQNALIDGFFRIAMELSSDFASMAMMSAIAGNSKNDAPKCAKIMFNHSRYKEWSEKHGKSLRKRISFN